MLYSIVHRRGDHYLDCVPVQPSIIVLVIGEEGKFEAAAVENHQT